MNIHTAGMATQCFVVMIHQHFRARLPCGIYIANIYGIFDGNQCRKSLGKNILNASLCLGKDLIPPPHTFITMSRSYNPIGLPLIFSDFAS